MKCKRAWICLLLGGLIIFLPGQVHALKKLSVTLVLYSPDKRQVVINLHRASDAEEKFVKENFFESYDHYVKELNPNVAATVASPDIYLAALSLNKSEEPAYVVVTESAMTCGSAGCIMSVWKKNKNSWIRIANGSHMMPLAVPDGDKIH